MFLVLVLPFIDAVADAVAEAQRILDVLAAVRAGNIVIEEKFAVLKQFSAIETAGSCYRRGLFGSAGQSLPQTGGKTIRI